MTDLGFLLVQLTYGKTLGNESGIGVQLESETRNESPDTDSGFQNCIEDFVGDVEIANEVL